MIFSCDKYKILISDYVFVKKKSLKMEILAGGLAASGACLFTNPLEVGIKTRLTIIKIIILTMTNTLKSHLLLL